MTDRRKFLIQAGLIGTSFIAAPELLSAKTSKKVGLQLYTLRDQLHKNVKGVIANVAKAGYQQVETFDYSTENGFWGLSPIEFKKVLQANSLTTPSGHYGMGRLLANGEMNEVETAIKTAKTLGQQYVTIPYIDENVRRTSADIKYLIKNINLAVERIGKAGLRTAYHNHDFEFKTVGNVMLYDVLLKETDPAHMHFEMDLYWVVRAGQDPLKWFAKYPGRFSMVHVKDMDKQEPQLNTEVGNGSVNFKHIFTKAKLAGIEHYLVEQENFKINPYTSITESSRYLRNVLLA
jgi:sugar phosphate isomerase/epimerase